MFKTSNMDFLKNSHNKVLVCIPTYNAADCLLDTIRSILSQTFKQFDILIIDNRSVDNTMKIIQQFKRDFDKENKIYVFSNKENIGRIRNWNECLEIFKKTYHPYLKFVFAGDTLENNYIETLTNVFQNNPGLGLVSSGYFVHYSGNKIRKKISFKKSMHFTPVNALKAFIKNDNWIGAPIACIISRKAVAGVKFSNEIEWAADWKFYVDITKRFESFYINEPLSNFYVSKRKYFLEHNTDPVARAEQLLVKQYALQKLKDLDPVTAKSLSNDLYKMEGEYLFQSLSLLDIGTLTVYKLAKIFKNILRSNNF